MWTWTLAAYNNFKFQRFTDFILTCKHLLKTRGKIVPAKFFSFLMQMFLLLFLSSLLYFSKTNRHVHGKSQKHKFTADGLSKLLSSRKFNWKNFWVNLENVVIKTILLCLPRAAECYDVCRPRRVNGEASVCFELLAFDLLLDANQMMWLVAVSCYCRFWN